jgi:cytochrome oxidase Cu insertion factor (SCO1/SenC/PrrC family)
LNDEIVEKILIKKLAKAKEKTITKRMRIKFDREKNLRRMKFKKKIKTFPNKIIAIKKNEQQIKKIKKSYGVILKNICYLIDYL